MNQWGHEINVYKSKVCMDGFILELSGIYFL